MTQRKRARGTVGIIGSKAGWTASGKQSTVCLPSLSTGWELLFAGPSDDRMLSFSPIGLMPGADSG